MERLLEKQKELTERVRANEKVVAAIGLLGSIAVAFIGAGYFAPKVEASPTAGEWIEKLREMYETQVLNHERNQGTSVDELEMRRVFNLGIGYCVVVPANRVELTMDIIRDEDINCWEIGEVYESSSSLS